MDRVLFTVVAYLPVISGALGIGFLSAYLYNRVIRKKHRQQEENFLCLHIR